MIDFRLAFEEATNAQQHPFNGTVIPQTSTIVLSWPSDASGAFSLSDLEAEIDALLTLRGDFTASFFSGDPSLRFKDFNADLVRFLH